MGRAFVENTRKLTSECLGRSTNRNSAVPELTVIISQGISTSRAALNLGSLQGSGVWSSRILLVIFKTKENFTT